MKRQIFILFAVLALALAASLMAQTPAPQTTQPLPPSQQVDQSGQPEQPGHPDVDVDAGKNAANGILDVDVERHGDADTKAQDNGTNTGTSTGTYGNNTGTTDSSAGTNDANAAGDNANLPGTASDMPLVGLLGLLSLAGAVTLRANC